jgi:type VI secretion system protein ImpE
MRLGPVLEAMIDGRYFWVPMNHIREIAIEAPTDLRDLVWLPARFTWSNGGSVVGFIPTRYAGTENSNDAALLLARKTEWQTQGEELSVGVGQRLFATDSAEFPILETRNIVLDVPLSPDDGASMNSEAVANG